MLSLPGWQLEHGSDSMAVRAYLGPLPRYFTLGEATGKAGEKRMTLTFNGKVRRACAGRPAAAACSAPAAQEAGVALSLDLRAAVAAACGAARRGQHGVRLLLADAALWGTAWRAAYLFRLTWLGVGCKNPSCRHGHARQHSQECRGSHVLIQ